MRLIGEWISDRRGDWLFWQTMHYFDWKHRRHGEQHPELDRYDHDGGDDQKWITIHEIVVETERDKEQLLAASHYIHNLLEIDTDYMGVNYIAHLYTTPDLIKVRQK